jgi:hypothetical protein
MSSAAAAVAGSVVTGLFNQRSANKSMRHSSAEAARQMRFQDRQSRTQYQRAVADMKAAGINPMLAAKLGGNAAMSGAAGSGAQATMPDIGATINSAENLRQMAPVRRAEASLKRAQREVARMQPAEIEAKIDQIRTNISESEVRQELNGLNIREKRLYVMTLEAARELDHEAYKQLTFGATKAMLDGLIETTINMENAMPTERDVIKFFQTMKDKGEGVYGRVLELLEDLE